MIYIATGLAQSVIQLLDGQLDLGPDIAGLSFRRRRVEHQDADGAELFRGRHIAARRVAQAAVALALGAIRQRRKRNIAFIRIGTRLQLDDRVRPAFHWHDPVTPGLELNVAIHVAAGDHEVAAVDR